MVHGNALNSYHKAQVYDEMDPKKLILMLYEGAIKRIVLAKEGVKKGDPKLRGENLGKAIAIISELNACLDDNIQTDEINFLRGLYAAMLAELPKVTVNNDIEILDRANKYLTELKKIWITTVLNNKIEDNPSDTEGTNKLNGDNLTSYTGNTRTHQSGSIAI